MEHLDMIKKLIYILLILPVYLSGQNNFFWSHPAVELFFLYTNEPQSPIGINYDIFFCDKPHDWAGTKMYILGGEQRSEIRQYTISNFKVGTASYSQSANVSGQDIYPTGMFIRNDGKKMYVIGTENDRIYQYSFSSDWIISTITYDFKYWDIFYNETAPTDLFFKPDGLECFIIGQQIDSVIHYSLLTAWDISTANFEEGYYVGNEDPNPTDIFFSPDGKKMYVAGSYTDKIYRYSLSDAWTLPAPWNTATVTLDNTFDIGLSYGPLDGIFIKRDWNKLYLTGGSNVHTFWLDE
jgi:DNA-binding beta-propeller fold protein YncE